MRFHPVTANFPQLQPVIVITLIRVTHAFSEKLVSAKDEADKSHKHSHLLTNINKIPPCTNIFRPLT